MKLKINNNIEAILFDMVGVLLFKKGNYAPKTKEEVTAEKIEELYNHLDDKKLLSDLKNKLRLTNEEISKALPYIPKKYERSNELWNLLPELKKKYKLAVVNNGNALALKYWKERFDFSIFDVFINSAEVGFKKPNPEIYLITCERLKVKPENCLFMDDLKENILIAEKLKMKTIWWEKDNEDEGLKKFISSMNLIR